MAGNDSSPDRDIRCVESCRGILTHTQPAPLIAERVLAFEEELDKVGVKDSSQSVRCIGVLLDHLDRPLFSAQRRCLYRESRASGLIRNRANAALGSGSPFAGFTSR
jgi:hypothetical protein